MLREIQYNLSSPIIHICDRQEFGLDNLETQRSGLDPQVRFRYLCLMKSFKNCLNGNETKRRA